MDRTTSVTKVKEKVSLQKCQNSHDSQIIIRKKWLEFSRLQVKDYLLILRWQDLRIRKALFMRYFVNHTFMINLL